ncbi:hypothetical protein D3C71_2118900 [compost metagenome]
MGRGAQHQRIAARQVQPAMGAGDHVLGRLQAVVSARGGALCFEVFGAATAAPDAHGDHDHQQDQ